MTQAPPGHASVSDLAGLLREFLGTYKKQLGLVTGLTAVQAAGILYLPSLNADVINDGVVTGEIGYIWRAGALMLGIDVAVSIVAIVAVYWASSVSMAMCADLRAAVYRQVQAFSAREISGFGLSSLLTRNVNDVQQVQLFLQMALTLLLLAIIICVGGTIMAVREGPALSLMLAVALPLMAVVIGVTLIRSVPAFRVVQARIDRINQVLREQITGIRVIRAFLRTRAEQDRFKAANSSLTRSSLRGYQITVVAVPVLMGILNLSSVAVIWFGGRLVSEGSMSIGNLTAFLIYILQVLTYVLAAAGVIVLVPRAAASAERIRQVLATQPAICDPPRPVTRRKLSGIVKFDRVGFGYPGSERPVLSNLTFSFRPGQRSAVIGGTGSGKTTLLRLIARFSDVTSGAVLVNGINVRKQAAEQVWASMSLIPQAAFLFGGTVGSNLRLGAPEATDEELWHALDIAQALDFVASMPGQLDAPIDQGGTNVSGGQRQRLCIARAVVRRPRVYLFDDCFSALDPATDARLRGALRAETRNATVVITAQRVSTIMDADQIIVLEGGTVAGIGPHQRLLAECGSYREIVASQLGEEPAA